MKRLAIVGSKDLGQLTAHHAGACGYHVIGFFDDFEPRGNHTARGPVLGPISGATAAFRAGAFDEFIVAIGYHHLDTRGRVFEELVKEVPAATIIHPSCYVDPAARVGRGSFLLPGSVLDAGVVVGENTVVNTGCILAHDTRVGQNCFLGPGVNLAGFIDVGRNCFLGVGTVVIDSVKICDQVQTGGGAVVIENISASGLYVGVPARRLKGK